MTRDVNRLFDSAFDLVVIGGGVHGLAAAYDAAQRGLAVALVERDDFGSGASFNHLKTVHGGLRYLQSMDLPRVRESIIERRTLAQIAPHLLTPLPYLMPTTSKLTRSRLAMRAAFAMDACLGFDRNRKVPPALRLPAGRLISRDECLRLHPDASLWRVTGGALWSDYQMTNPDRLTLALALAADRHGACLLNYVEALEPVVQDRSVTAVRVRDRVTGETRNVRTRLMLNAAGAAAGQFMRALGARRVVPLLKAMNLVTRRPLDGPALASSTRDGRLLFLVPWLGRALVGTAHAEKPCEPEDTAVTAAELEGFLATVNEAFPSLRLTHADITMVHRGVVAARRGASGALTLEGHHKIHDHARDGIEGALSIISSKYTTARAVAEKAVDRVVRKLGRRCAKCRTAVTPLPGADGVELAALLQRATSGTHTGLDTAVCEELVRTYGIDWSRITALAAEVPALAERLAPNRTVIRAQVVHAVRHEMARTLVDVVVRRTSLGSAGHPGAEAAQAAAFVMQAELGWSDSTKESELARLREFYQPIAVKA